MAAAIITPLFHYQYQISAPPRMHGVTLTAHGWFDFCRVAAAAGGRRTGLSRTALRLAALSATIVAATQFLSCRPNVYRERPKPKKVIL